MTKTIETEPATRNTVTHLARYGAIAGIVASIVNGLVRVVAISLLDVSAEFQPLGWGPVITTTVVGVVGATGVYGLLTRISPRPNRTFLAVVVVVLLLSFGPLVAPPAFLAVAPSSVLATLGVMHLTTAVVVVGVLVRANTPGATAR